MNTQTKAMNLELEAVYFCANSGHRWGKGYSPTEAKKNAGITTKAQEKSCQFYVMAAILNEPSVEELKNLFKCITANNFSGSPEYYNDNRTEEDTNMIHEKHVGWLMIEKNF